LADDDVVLVEVEGEPVTKAMLEYLMTVRGVEEGDLDGMRALFDELIRLQTVANAAAREGISARTEVRAERMLKDIEVQYVRYLEQFQQDNPVSDQDVQTAYRDQIRRSGDTRWRLETIEFADQAAALETVRELRAGQQTFQQALERAAGQQRIARRTDWVDASQVPPSFQPVLTTTAVGEVVEDVMPFETRWLVVRVAEREALQAPPLDEVREGIRRSLLREKSQAMIDLLFEQAEITPMLPLEGSDAANPAGD
jgi:peptidyl-prolyl cis-trans isomerase C